MSSYLPPLVALTAIVLTYVFCIRPMRRRSCGTTAAAASRHDEALRRELELTRTELALLRAREHTDDR